MKNNVFIRILVFSAVITAFRYLFGMLQLEIPYAIDIILLILFGLTAVSNYRISKQPRLNFYFTFGMLQIISSIVVFDTVKIIIYSPDLTPAYLLKRLIVAVGVLFVGLIANGLSLLLFCKETPGNKQENRSDIIDR